MNAPGTLLIPRGLPASGKTTWARHAVDQWLPGMPGGVVRLNRDDIRAMMLRSDYRQPSGFQEDLVTAVQHGPIGRLLRAGVDVIVDDTNLRARNVRTLAMEAVRVGAQWRVVDDFLDVPLEVCLERDRRRTNPVGDEVITAMWGRFLSGGRRPPVPEVAPDVLGRTYTPPPGAPKVVMVDIDGTVALHTGVRGPYDTSRYHLDAPNPAVVEAVRQEAGCVQGIVFCSGRSEDFRDVTEAWLDEHVLPRTYGWDLFMRKSGDVRNDAIVKLELFDRHIRDHYDVRRVYDDRDRVVATWRSIGLTVLQVAEGNF